MVYCAFSYLFLGHDVQMHQLGVEVQIGVDRGVVVDRYIAVLQGDVRALHNDLKSNHKTMLRQLERLMTNQVAGGPLAAQSTQLNSEYQLFILARFGVLTADITPCRRIVVCVVPKHTFCSELLNLMHYSPKCRKLPTSTTWRKAPGDFSRHVLFSNLEPHSVDSF